MWSAQASRSAEVFLCWMSAAVLQGCFLPLAAFTLFSDGSRSNEGPAVDSLWLVGTGIFFWVVLGVNLTLARRLSVVLPLTVVAFVGSVSAFPIITLLLDETGSPFLRGVFALLFGHQSLRYALATCLVMVAFLLIGEPLLARAEPDGDAPPRAGLPKPPIGSEGHEPMTLGSCLSVYRSIGLSVYLLDQAPGKTGCCPYPGRKSQKSITDTCTLEAVNIQVGSLAGVTYPEARRGTLAGCALAKRVSSFLDRFVIPFRYSNVRLMLFKIGINILLHCSAQQNTTRLDTTVPHFCVPDHDCPV